MTRTLLPLMLVAILATPSLAVAQEPKGGILASAERLAKGIELQQEEAGTRRSVGRLALGVALAGAGVAMLLIDPEQPVQPTQPGIVSLDVLVSETAAVIASPAFANIIINLGTTFLCFPNVPRSCEFTADAYISGVVDGAINGAAAALVVATNGARTVYEGPFQPFIPFEERSAGLKYGGAALAIGGALVAGLWSNVPVMNQLSVTPTVGGLRLSTSVGF